MNEGVKKVSTRVCSDNLNIFCSIKFIFTCTYFDFILVPLKNVFLLSAVEYYF